jgi:hypothetical protein
MRSTFLLLFSLLALSACGGGGSDSASSSSSANASTTSTTSTTNMAPTIAGAPAASVMANATYTFAPSASDANGDALSFTISGQPTWATFNAASGQLSGTPGMSQVGNYPNIQISVSDGKATTSLPMFSITVQTPPATNVAPTIAGTPPASVTAGIAYSFTPVAADANGDALTFSVANKPAWASFNTTTGQLSGTAAASQIGSYANIQITVSDGKVTASLPTFSITVLAVGVGNTPPSISGTPAATVTAGIAYNFTPTAFDANGDALTFSIQNKPSWATFSTSNGRLNGTPIASNVGSFANIIISVSDGKASVALSAFTIAVQTQANAAPTIGGTPATTVTAGGAYSFTPTSADANADPLTFSIQNKPSWATFTASTGRLSGTTTTANIGTYANIIISVTDGKATTSLAAFAIAVQAATNTAPTIAGTPATTIIAGSAYSFTPTAADANNDTLSFSIQNKPSWASFNLASGQLSGTPTTANLGSFAGIVISVSDGSATTALATFTITVTQVNSGSAALTWSTPTQNTDGSALTDLAGFRLYYGTNPSSLDQTTQISSATQSSYTVTGLSSGTWYFAMTSYNTANVESDRSGTASKVVP